MDNVLQGKSALVVGGTSGIGYCLAQSLLQESVSVVMQGQSNSKRVTSLCSQGNVACFICDLQKAFIDKKTISTRPATTQGRQIAVLFALFPT